MPLMQKSFTEIVSSQTQEGLKNAIATIDNAVNTFLQEIHWSQARDSFQSLTVVNETVVITRTVVYTTEQLAFNPTGKPPVGPQS